MIDLSIIRKRWKDIVVDVVLAGAVNAVYLSIILGIFLYFRAVKDFRELVAEPDTFYVWYYPALVVFYAAEEEVKFRLIPLSGAVWASYLWLRYVLKKDSPKTVAAIAIIVAIVASAYFGYTHGDWRNIFVQGFGGLAFAYIFLKYGGTERKLVVPLICSTFCHALFNMVYLTPLVASYFLAQ